MARNWDDLTEMTIQRDTLILALTDVYVLLDAANAEVRRLIRRVDELEDNPSVQDFIKWLDDEYPDLYEASHHHNYGWTYTMVWAGKLLAEFEQSRLDNPTGKV